MRRPRVTRRWEATAVVEHWLAGEQLDWITCQSHAPRGQQHATYWLNTPEGGKALLENEETLRRFVRRLVKRASAR